MYPPVIYLRDFPTSLAMRKLYFLTNVLLAIFLISCKETVPGKDESDHLAGEFYYQAIDNSNMQRDIKLKITDTGYKTFDVELSGFPGPFYEDSTVNVKAILVNFKIVVNENTGYLDFEAEQDAFLEGKKIYRAKFHVELMPNASLHQMKVTFVRTDSGSQYTKLFSYMMHSKSA